RLAPIALEPIPASHANTIFLISPSISILSSFLFFNSFIFTVAFSSSSSFNSLLEDLTNIDATKKDTAVDTNTPKDTPTKEPLGVIANSATILPGEGVATRPALNRSKINTPLAPPAIIARIKAGFIKTYAKYISCIPAKKCIIVALNVDYLKVYLPNVK